MAEETARLADYAASCRYEHIPPDVVERAKQCITDTVAAAIFGCGLPWSRIVVKFAQKNGARGNSRILGPDGGCVHAPACILAQRCCLRHSRSRRSADKAAASSSRRSLPAPRS